MKRDVQDVLLSIKPHWITKIISGEPGGFAELRRCGDGQTIIQCSVGDMFK